jgi:capsular exopolysaccharide synthesis family protein
MERIKQALERARAEREAAADAGSPLLEVDPVGLRHRLRQTRLPMSEVKVTYTSTATTSVDAARLREQRIILTEEHDLVADAYKVLRTHVLQRMRANGWKTLALTSPGEGNGKTLTAINLAISLAREVNQTILLVDLDLRRPSLGRYFVDGPTLGISDYLTEGADLADLLIHPGIERLVVLPGNHSFTQSSEMLSSPRMVQLVNELKARYTDRLTLFDMPPLLAGDDVIAFLPYVDAVLLVIEEGKTTKNELERSYPLLGDKNILGTVLNKSAEASSGIGYY